MVHGQLRSIALGMQGCGAQRLGREHAHVAAWRQRAVEIARAQPEMREIEVRYDDHVGGGGGCRRLRQG